MSHSVTPPNPHSAGHPTHRVRDWIGLAAAVLAVLVFPLWLKAYVAAETGLPWLALPLALLAVWRPGWALGGLLALWPVLDRTLTSGSLFATESDLAALAVVAGSGLGGLRLRAASPSALRAAPLAVLGFALLVALFGVGIWRAFEAGPLIVDGLPLAGFSSPHNALRIAKGLLWALLLAPVAHRAQRESATPATGFDWLFGGMVAALALVCGAAILERLRFTGLSDFSSDYRITAPFWEMHVGGAALDGFLALALPFALSWAVFERRHWRMASGLLVSALALYVAFVTFSRGVYAALLVAVLVLVVARLGGRLRPLALSLIAAGLVMFGLSHVFALAGYRGLAALLALALLVIALPLSGPRPRGGQALSALLLAMALALGAGASTLVLAKGAYFAFAGLALLAAGLIGLARLRGGMTLALLAQAALTALLPAAMLVGRHWGGAQAGWVVGAVGLLLLAPAWLREGALLPAWRPLGAAARGAATLLLLAAGASVALGQNYMAGRFSQSSEDLGGRMAHWRSIAALLRTPADLAVGIGLGRLPEAYFWAAPGNQFPGGFALRSSDEDAALHLIAPRHPLGWGDMLRVGQQLPADAVAPFVLTLEYRTTAPSELHAEVCRRQLIYAHACAVRDQGLAASTEWRPLKLLMPPGGLAGKAAWAPPQFFALALGQPGSVAELRHISLIDSRGMSLLENGALRPDGRGGLAHWFFTSDRLHLAWHAKNLWLALACDVGLLGAAVFSMLLLGALARLALGRARGQPLATVLFAALAGFAVVGLFDSLIDVPRVAMLAMLMIWLALCLRRTGR